MSAKPVSIIIPSWKGRALLQQHLPSVVAATEHYRQKTGSSAEIIVVEDGGDDDTPEWLNQSYGTQVILKRRSVQGGFGAACNTGFEQARGPIVVLLNNDVTIATDALIHLTPHFDDHQLFAVTCRAMETDSEVVASGGRIGEFRKGFWRVYCNYDVSEPLRDQSSEYASLLASGGFSAFDLEKVRRLGGFNPLLRPFYWEDVELSLRAWHRGWKILYEPRAEVHHAASSTIGARFTRRQTRRINERNRLIVHWIHVHDTGRLFRHFLGLMGFLISSFFKMDWAALRGFADAISERPEIRLRRRQEKAERILSDRIIEFTFRRLRQRPDVMVFSSREEFLRLRQRSS